MAQPTHLKEANGDFMMLDYHAASRLIKATNNTVDNFYHNSDMKKTKRCTKISILL